MSLWKKPEPVPEGERMHTPEAPIDVLVLGARGVVDWRAKVLPALDAAGLVYHDPGGILVRTDKLPSIGCVLVGIGDPGSGNDGLETWYALGQCLGASGPYDGRPLVAFRFGELGEAFTAHDKEQFAALLEALGRSRVHVAEDPAEAARACAARRAYRWDDDEVEVETVTTRRRMKGAKK